MQDEWHMESNRCAWSSPLLPKCIKWQSINRYDWWFKAETRFDEVNNELNAHLADCQQATSQMHHRVNHLNDWLIDWSIDHLCAFSISYWLDWCDWLDGEIQTCVASNRRIIMMMWSVCSDPISCWTNNLFDLITITKNRHCKPTNWIWMTIFQPSSQARQVLIAIVHNE